MNPLKLLFTKTESGQYDLQTQSDTNVSFTEVVNFIGALVWMIAITVSWSNDGLFSDTLGRIGYIPVLFIAGAIGFYTTAFIVYTSLVITVIGCTLGWIFDFSFLNILSAFISKIF